MQANRTARAGILGLSILLMSSCAEVGTVGQKSFQSQYTTARTALEKGQFDKANRAYLQMLPDAGALEPRLKLELSHSYLRAGNFDKAAQMAGNLANAQQGTGRAAALSVQATADHEIGLIALKKGDKETGKTHLERAKLALTEVLEKHPDLDPLGGMAGRMASIEVRLNGMR
ncbi:hypothetical protein [Sulfitobacter aestuariivivens]|uniref:Tetratricopeptide repeat protein n=1 Tax=Sulfitobacter aestuariivivens TaxID=2766981 RepID=A0A927HFY9_9RHOB|nr:hypothetical protein [Sulfitobacter aestuariivivens]MBD3664943.1 hypothetical protein [Sulfitobacter aestuariivivens]